MNFLKVPLVAILLLFIYTCCELQKEQFGKSFIFTSCVIKGLKWVETQIDKNEPNTFWEHLKLNFLCSIDIIIHTFAIIDVLTGKIFIGLPLRVLGCITLTLFNINPVGRTSRRTPLTPNCSSRFHEAPPLRP